MGRLNTSQIQQVISFLKMQEITFEPLKNELLDHLILDIEDQLDKGKSFEEAFSIITQQLPKHQLLTIEQETMEAITKQSTITSRLSYLGLILLMLTSAFKMMHLSGTTFLLFSSIGAFASTLIVGALTGIRRYRDKLGAGLLIGVILSIIVHILAWAFIILQLPRANELKIISISALIVTFSIATYRFASNERFSNSILSYLHEKYSAGIERVLLIVLVAAGILKAVALGMGYPPNVAMVLLVFVISGGLLHFFAMNWHFELSKTKSLLLMALFIVGMLPALGPILTLPIRSLLAGNFYIAAAMLCLTSVETNWVQKGSMIITSLFYSLWSLNLLGFAFFEYNTLFRPGILLLLVAFLGMSRQHPLLRVYFIMVIAHYLLEYPMENGLAF